MSREGELMSQPSIPNMTPIVSVSKKDTISMLLSSIAMNEMAMSHLINAEAEKIQSFVKYTEVGKGIKTNDFIHFNNTVSRFLEEATMEQWLNLNKLDRVIHLLDQHYDSCKEEHSSQELDDYGEYYDE